MKEYCILNHKIIPTFALSLYEGANNLTPKTPMGKKDGDIQLLYHYEYI